jgi:hypothetical protein
MIDGQMAMRELPQDTEKNGCVSYVLFDRNWEASAVNRAIYRQDELTWNRVHELVDWHSARPCRSRDKV